MYIYILYMMSGLSNNLQEENIQSNTGKCNMTFFNNLNKNLLNFDMVLSKKQVAIWRQLFQIST